MKSHELKSKEDTIEALDTDIVTIDTQALSEMEINYLTKDIKNILADEKVSSEKHDQFVQLQINYMNKMISLSNKISRDTGTNLENTIKSYSENVCSVLAIKQNSQEYRNTIIALGEIPIIRNFNKFINHKLLGYESGLETSHAGFFKCGLTKEIQEANKNTTPLSLCR